MKRTLFLLAVVSAVALVAWAQVPVRELDDMSGQSAGGTPSQPVDVTNFPTDEEGSLLVTSPQRVLEQYLVLDPADAACQWGASNYWRLPVPPGGPWASLTFHFLAGSNLRFAVAEWNDPAANPHSPDCDGECDCGVLSESILVPGSGPPTSLSGHVLVMGDQIWITGNGPNERRVYLRWER